MEIRLDNVTVNWHSLMVVVANKARDLYHDPRHVANATDITAMRSAVKQLDELADEAEDYYAEHVSTGGVGNGS